MFAILFLGVNVLFFDLNTQSFEVGGNSYFVIKLFVQIRGPP